VYVNLAARYIIAGQKTEYTYDFGNTQAENAATGTIFVILGLVFSIVPVCGIFLAVDCAKKRKAENATHQVPVRDENPPILLAACLSIGLVADYRVPALRSLCVADEYAEFWHGRHPLRPAGWLWAKCWPGWLRAAAAGTTL
jgi:hypothetical protein